MALPLPPDHREPIPNNPFYTPSEDVILQGAYYPIAVGSGITVDLAGSIPVISASGGGGGTGTVTQINTGAGLTGGPINTSGTIALANTTVTPGTYTHATITVDPQGRLLSASSGSVPSGTVTSVTAGSGLSGGTITTSGVLSLNTNCVISPSILSAKGAILTAASPGNPAALPVGTNGKVLSVNLSCSEGLEWVSPSTGTLTSVDTGTGLTGGPITTSGTIALANTAVSPGTYTHATITVDPQGRVTSAASGTVTSGTVTCVVAGSGLSGGPITTHGTLSLDTSCVIQPSIFTSKGDLISSTGSSSPVSLPAGANGQVLSANSSCSAGLEWVTPAAGTVTNISTGTGLTGGPISSTGIIALADTAVFPGVYSYSSITVDQQGRLTAASSGATPVVPADFTAKGAVLVGTGVGTYCALGVGANGTILTANSSTGSGLCWASYSALNLCGYTCTSPSFNSAFGVNAGSAVTTGTNNTFLGFDSGKAITSGSQSVLIGSGAGASATTSSGLTAIGFCSATATTGSDCSTFLGFVSGRNSTGATNTYVGALTGCATSNSSACGTLLGFCSGSALTTGNANTLIGFQAGRSVAGGSFNVAVGAAALQTASSAACNVAIGCGALSGLSTTTGNVAIGHRAMINASTAGNNVVVGGGAGTLISTATGNILVGFTAGDAITTGSNNTVIGDIAGSSTLANNLILGAGTTVKLQVNENGALGVGPTPSYGSSGQVLVSAGSGAPPTWSNGGGGSTSAYGQFSSSLTQTNNNLVNGNVATFNTVATSPNMSLLSGSRVTPSLGGIYNIQVSIQVAKIDSGTDAFTFWFKKNGTNIPDSATSLSLSGNNAAQLASMNILESLSPGEYVELWWLSPDPNIQLTASVASAPYPATPSVILTAILVSAL